MFFGADDGKPAELMLPVWEPMPARPGPEWQEQWTVCLKCLNGADAGAEVEYKATNQGCLDAIGGLFNAIRDRLTTGQHNDEVCPILLLEKSSYLHPQYGRTGIPVMTIVGWMPFTGPKPASASPPPPRTRSPKVAATPIWPRQSLSMYR